MSWKYVMTDSLQCTTALKHQVTIVLLILLLLAACRSSQVAEKPIEHASHSIVVDTIRIPILSTPKEQLAYARSTFAENTEKVAALKAIKLLHPTERQLVGIAAMELAYLQLGDDYRLAGKHQLNLTTQSYLQILADYSDIPNIAAKVLWYLGWISCDLRVDRQKGLTYYQRILDVYPNEKLNFLPPSPWLSMFRLDKSMKNQRQAPESVLTWADLARLEIIHNTTDHDYAWSSFAVIQGGKANEVFKGLALKVLVTQHGISPQSEQLIKNYLDSSTTDEILKNDLLLLLSAYRKSSVPGRAGQ